LFWCSPIYSFFILDAEPFEFYLGSLSLYLFVPVYFLIHELFQSFRPCSKVFDPLRVDFGKVERQGSSLNLLYMDIKFSQQHLLKRLAVDACYVWVFYSEPMVFLSVFMNGLPFCFIGMAL
jgi:hypothetical protein